jgi:hypothetical protein
MFQWYTLQLYSKMSVNIYTKNSIFSVAGRQREANARAGHTNNIVFQSELPLSCTKIVVETYALGGVDFDKFFISKV